MLVKPANIYIHVLCDMVQSVCRSAPLGFDSACRPSDEFWHKPCSGQNRRFLEAGCSIGQSRHCNSCKLVSRQHFLLLVWLVTAQTIIFEAEVHDCETLSRQDKRLHLFQPAWLIRCLIHRLDQFPASSSYQHL